MRTRDLVRALKRSGFSRVEQVPEYSDHLCVALRLFALVGGRTVWTLVVIARRAPRDFALRYVSEKAKQKIASLVETPR